MNIIIPNSKLAKPEVYIPSSDPRVAETQEYIPSSDPRVAETQVYIAPRDPRVAETQESHSASGSKDNKKTTKPDTRPRTPDSGKIMDLFSAQKNNITALINFIELRSQGDSPDEQIVYLKNLFDGQFTEVNIRAFDNLSVLAKEHGVTEDELHDFFREQTFYKDIKHLLRVDQPKPTLLEPTAINPKSKKSLIEPLVASFLVTIGVGGGTHAIVNSGNSGPSGMSHEVVVEPIRQIHQSSSTKTLSLNDKSNTFEELQQYFAQNPDENSNWSVIFKMIKNDNLAQVFKGRSISIIDFDNYEGPAKFRSYGKDVTLKQYFDDISSASKPGRPVFPPAAWVMDIEGNISFNNNLLLNVPPNWESLPNLSLEELLGTNFYGKTFSGEPPRNFLLCLVTRLPDQNSPEELSSRYWKMRIEQKANPIDFINQHASQVPNSNSNVVRAVSFSNQGK